MNKLSYVKGVVAEKIICKFLEADNYKIIKKRYKSKYGEIDIIALKEDTLIVGEVKARKIESDGIIAVNERTRRRIEIKIFNYRGENLVLSRTFAVFLA